MTSAPWYPGHVAITRRQVAELLRAADGCLEVADARAPAATRASGLEAVLGRRPRLLVLTHADAADPAKTAAWCRALDAVAVDAVRGTGLPELRRRAARIPSRRPGLRPRLVVVGLPNVGKSSLINRLAGRHRARAGARPGLTRGPQVVDAGPLELVDLPGVLPPRRPTPVLALLGVVPDTAFDPEEAAAALWHALPSARRPVAASSPHEALVALARERGLLGAGGAPDTHQAALHLLYAFREGRLGRLTLEEPPEDGHAEG